MARQLRPLFCNSSIFIKRWKLLAPPVENPVAGNSLLTIEHIDRPRVAKPRIVDGQRNNINCVAAQQLGALNVCLVSDHGYRLECGDCSSKCGVRHARVTHSVVIQIGPRRPTNYRSLVASKLARHFHAMSPSSVTSGKYNSGRRSRNKPHALRIVRKCSRSKEAIKTVSSSRFASATFAPVASAINEEP